jgi:hypothetical protein
MAKPAGSSPHEIEKVYGAVPPLTFSVALKLTPTVAGGIVPESVSPLSAGFDSNAVALDADAVLTPQAGSAAKPSSKLVKAKS